MRRPGERSDAGACCCVTSPHAGSVRGTSRVPHLPRRQPWVRGRPHGPGPEARGVPRRVSRRRCIRARHTSCVASSGLVVLNRWCCPADLIDLFEDEQTDSVIINYGENTINTRQINQQINEDLYWAVLSMAFAALMLRIGSGSWFMTVAGIFQIIVRRPADPPPGPAALLRHSSHRRDMHTPFTSARAGHTPQTPTATRALQPRPPPAGAHGGSLAHCLPSSRHAVPFTCAAITHAGTGALWAHMHAPCDPALGSPLQGSCLFRRPRLICA